MNGLPQSSFPETSRHTSLKISPPLLPDNALGSAISLISLFNIVFKKLHPLFSIDCGVVLIYDEQITVIQEAYISTYLSDREEIHTGVINQPSELTRLQKIIAGFSFPVIKSMAEWEEEENVNHCLVNNETHYKYHCYIPLEIENKILGTLELHNNTREFSTECLMFCSNIADFLADILYLQHIQPLKPDNQKAALTNHSPKLTAESINTESAPHTDLLLKLNEQLVQINESDTLDNFFSKAASLFPLAYKKIKKQLEEIDAFKTQREDESLHTLPGDMAPGNYPEIIGAGPGMKKVFALMDQVSGSESSVLIMGETGTGKELIARAIHERSERKDKTMIKVNCAAIPANLIESELFGHEKGAFTGATDRRIGKFELADNSTLFLDEIGELPLDLQVKLLRVLQEKEIERVGGKTTIKTDVRIISATNRDLFAEVERGNFRRDLYYRLNVFPINLPPLRERTEDIPLLAAYFLDRYCKQKTGFTQRAVKQMINYRWPGNVREMEHLIERQVLLSTKPVISEINIPAAVKTIPDKAGTPQKIKTIEENERDHIFAVLQLCKGRVSGTEGAARLLGVPATTLNSKIKRLRLNKKHF
ncbi:sigma-54 interaction domain-containing protein [Mucilaginibacter angelicae]|uniref:Sigma-54 interaction domain-containing protein n=1 Tax=Mucilaginibacter angelicae TaxID=869718 RepID=A0ABV6L1E5_9SPHI